MRILLTALLLFFAIFFNSPSDLLAANSPSILEMCVSNTLDLWRDGRYEQLYEQLANRSKLSREHFVETMRSSTTKPACCFQKINNFKVLEQKKATATIYARIGLETSPDQAGYTTREFKLKKQGGEWRMQMNDVLKLAGGRVKKHRKSYYRKH